MPTIARRIIGRPPGSRSSRRERAVDVGGEGGRGGGGRRAERSDHDEGAVRESVEAITHDVTKATADLAAHHGTSDPSTHDEADPGGVGGVVLGGRPVGRARAPRSVREPARRPPRTARTKLLGPPHATVSGKHETRQAESFARPLLRRLARIARPARVRMRSRKPCVLARRRLFGWKVRLLTWGSRDDAGKTKGDHDDRSSPRHGQTAPRYAARSDRSNPGWRSSPAPPGRTRRSTSNVPMPHGVDPNRVSHKVTAGTELGLTG